MNENHPFFSPDPPACNPGQRPEWMDIPRRADWPGDFQATPVKSRMPVMQADFEAGVRRVQTPFIAVTPNMNGFHSIR